MVLAVGHGTTVEWMRGMFYVCGAGLDYVMQMTGIDGVFGVALFGTFSIRWHVRILWTPKQAFNILQMPQSIMSSSCKRESHRWPKQTQNKQQSSTSLLEKLTYDVCTFTHW